MWRRDLLSDLNLIYFLLKCYTSATFSKLLRHEIFVLGVPGFLKTTQACQKIPKKTSETLEDIQSLPMAIVKNITMNKI